jgi:hypothetical protein
VSARVFPSIPDAGEGEQLSVIDLEAVRLAGLAVALAE